MLRLLFLTLLLGTSSAAQAREQDRADFVEANLVWVFYHEAAHAMIDHLGLPVLGREEDAADLLAVLLIDEIWEPDSATQLAWYQALGWFTTVEANADEDDAYWGVHGLDRQRFYTHVCLWYGANPDERQDFAETFDLPEARAEGCAEEYSLAHRSWFDLLDPYRAEEPSRAFVFKSRDTDFGAEVIAEEVRTLNALFDLPARITVTIEACDEVNAFYIPSESQIIICREYIDDLWEQAEALDL